MKIIWCLFYILFILNLIIKINGQDDDYDVEPDEITNEFMASEQPEFYKNAFAEGGQSGSRQSPASYSNDLWAPYLRYFPFSNIDAKSMSPYYSPFYSPYSVPAPMSFNGGGGNKESSGPRAIKGFHDKVKRRPDFLNSDFDFSALKPTDLDDSKPKSLEPPQEHHKPMMFNNYNSLPFNPQFHQPYSTAGRFNPYQNGLPDPHLGMPSPPHHRPVGSDLFPYTQQGRQKDNFDEELKKLGIDLDEYLGDGSSQESKGKEKHKRKKKDKKVKPITPTIIPFRQVTTTENPTQHQLLKSHVENDILNFGVNMNQYGIKEHNVEKQVFGNTPQSYQYPMQANTFNNNDPSQANTFNQGTLNGNLNGLGSQGTDAFRNSLNGQFDFDTVSNLDTLNNMLKYSPTGVHETINPVFTADNEVQNALTPLNDVAFNLIEANLNNYRGTHEYHTNDHSNNNIDEHFKSFPNGQKTELTQTPKPEDKPPSFLQDAFFKEKSTKNKDNEESENGEGGEDDDNDAADHKKSRGRKDARSKKYFESVTPKPKSVSYSSSITSNDNEKDGSSGDNNNEEDGKDTKPRYNEEKPTYSKEYKPKGYGYRYYRQNYHPDSNSNYDSNKKGDTMKLVGKSTGEEDSNQEGDSQSKSNESSNNNQEEEQSSAAAEGDKYSSEGKTSDKGEVEDGGNKDDEGSKDEGGNEGSDGPKESQSARSNDENNNNGSNEDKVDEEFSGSKKRKKRSITNAHYFSSVLKDRRLKNRDADDNELEDNEEELIDLNRPRELYFKRKLELAQQRQASSLNENRYLPSTRSNRRRKIVTFDEPSASYLRRNLDSSESFDEDLDFFRKKNLKSRSRRPMYKTLKDEYDDEFKYLKSKNRKAKLERRKCNGSNSGLRLNRIYSRDDKDSYNGLRKHPMYKFYQLIR